MPLKFYKIRSVPLPSPFSSISSLLHLLLSPVSSLLSHSALTTAKPLLQLGRAAVSSVELDLCVDGAEKVVETGGGDLVSKRAKRKELGSIWSPSPPRSPSLTPCPLAAGPPSTGPPDPEAAAVASPNPGGRREDAWSEGATAVLGRGSLRHPQWPEVADAVSSREGYAKAPKSSSWQFFGRLDDLLAPTFN
uniref:Uncharacterized protein n=1 Tax=Oryza glumipatula TaxID=40148 RepID=A0A0D9ZHG7_9ORYZ